jgi:hypothetical protein
MLAEVLRKELSMITPLIHEADRLTWKVAVVHDQHEFSASWPRRGWRSETTASSHGGDIHARGHGGPRRWGKMNSG